MDKSNREILMLRFRDELGLEEMARVIGVPLSTVKSRLYRGIAALRVHLQRSRLAQNSS